MTLNVNKVQMKSNSNTVEVTHIEVVSTSQEWSVFASLNVFNSEFNDFMYMYCIKQYPQESQE